MPAVIPIVLHHGLFGFGEFQLGRYRVSYYHKIAEMIAARGHPVIVTRVHPTGGIERRARQLKAAILRQCQRLGCADHKLLILGHSMGGLDARYMLAHLGMADRVTGLITISTPHRGSAYADYCVRHLGRLGALKLLRSIGLDVQAASDLTPASCARFNQCVPDAPGVKYFSVTAARPWQRITPVLLHSHRVIEPIEGPNDGLVSVDSGTWGQHLGTWPADHLHVINKRLVIEMEEKTGDIRPFYGRMLDEVLPQLDDSPPTRPRASTPPGSAAAPAARAG